MQEFLNWVPMLVIVAIVVAIVLYDRRRGADGPSVNPENPVGIGGWLILPAIAIIVGPLLAFVNAAKLISYVGSSAVEALDRTVAFVEIASSAAIGAFGAYVAVRFFQYRRNVPKLYIVLALISVTYTIVDSLVVVALFGWPDEGDSTGPLIGAPLLGTPLYSVIWILYMLRSVRVRNTFTR